MNKFEAAVESQQLDKSCNAKYTVFHLLCQSNMRCYSLGTLLTPCKQIQRIHLAG